MAECVTHSDWPAIVLVLGLILGPALLAILHKALSRSDVGSDHSEEAE